MRRPGVLTTLVVGLTTSVAGCSFESVGRVNPITASSVTDHVSVTPVLLGTWTATAGNTTIGGSTSFPTASSCTDLEWAITEQNGSTYSGTFTVRCDGGIVLSGTATGTLTNTVLNINATGNAVIPGAASCPFTLSGSASFIGDDIHINYVGSSCLGPINGAEVLAKG